ncbi:MAG: NAD(+) kinase [Campylobacter sp.]|nr:NAD(+) kinase [Campylobacter sp.]
MENQNNKIHLNLNTIGLVAKKSEEIVPQIEKIAKILKKKNINLLVEKSSAEFFGLKGVEFKEILENTNVFISLGGDGTLISTARTLALKNAFILGVHAGTLGFLTDTKLDEFAKFMDDFLGGNYEIQKPIILDVVLENKNGKVIKKVAFNDVVITRSLTSSMAKIDAFLNRKYFNTYFGDGVLVSSPVGSTAYNMSSGGSIVYPLCDVFCLTPICSHSLSQRPLILPKDCMVSFKNSGGSEVSIVIDGQDAFDMSEFKSVSVGINKTRISLIRNAKADYFDILKEKLGWGQNA